MLIIVKINMTIQSFTSQLAVLTIVWQWGGEYIGERSYAVRGLYPSKALGQTTDIVLCV